MRQCNGAAYPTEVNSYKSKPATERPERVQFRKKYTLKQAFQTPYD